MRLFRKTLFLLFFIPQILCATSYTWNATGGAWAQDSNWLPDTAFPNSSADSATFPDIPSTSPLITVIGNLSVGTMTFTNNVGDNYTIGSMGGTLTVYNDIQSTGTSESTTISCPISLGSNITIGPGTSGTITFSSSPSAISGSFGITLNGAGTMMITGSCSYTGTTTITNGTLAGNGGFGLFPSSSAFVLAATSTAVVNLGGGSETIASLTGGAGSQMILDGGQLTVGDSTPSTTFAGSIIDGSTSGGPLTKQGTGTLVLSGTNTYSGETTIDAGALSISSTGNLGTNTIVFQGGNLNVTGNATLAQQISILGNASITTSSGTTALIIGTITVGLAEPYTLTLGGSGTNSIGVLSTGMGGTLIVAGAMGGTTSLTCTGGGTLEFSGSNTYTGGTTISQGTVELISGGSLPSGGDVVIDGTLNITSGPSSQTIGNLSGTGNALMLGGVALTAGTSNSGTFTGVISGTGSFTKQGSGTLVLEGVNTYSGGTTISAGKVTLAGGLAAFASSSNVVNNGTLDLSSGSSDPTLGDLSGSGAWVLGSGGLTFGTSTSSTTLSGPISGTGALTKQGSGTVILSGSNTYSGETTISAGTFSISSGSNFGTNTIAFEGGNLAVTASATLAQQMSILGNTSITTSSGATTLITGTITLGGESYTLTLAGGGTNSIEILSTGMGIGTLTVIGPIGGTTSLTCTGGGTITFSGNHTYTGGTTTIAQGVVELVSGGSFPSGGDVVIDGTLNIGSGASSQTIGNLGGTGDALILGSVALTAGTSNTGTFTGVISGTGSFTKQGSGTLVLEGVNTYTGGTTISAGKLTVAGGLGALASGSNVVNNGTLDLSGGAGNPTLGDLSGSGTWVLGGIGLTFGTSTSSTTLSGAISSTGTLVKQGSGKVILGGACSGSFQMDINAGTLVVNGSLPGEVIVNNAATLKGSGSIAGTTIIEGGGIIAPGNSVGTMNLASLTFNSTSVYNVEIDPSASSFLDCSGAATLASATVQLTVDSGDYPHTNTYQILEAASISGSFTSTVTNVPAGFHFSLSQSGESIYLSYYLSSISTAGLSGNQSHIADYFNLYGTSTSILLLYPLSGSSLQSALNSISPARNAYSAYVAEQTALSCSSQVSSHLDHYRLARRKAAKESLTALLADASENICKLQPNRSCPTVPCDDSPCYAWLSGFGGFGHQKASHQNPSFNYNAGGALLGVDCLWSRDSLFGAAFGYSRSNYNDANHAGSGGISAFFLSAYANFFIDSFYISPALWVISDNTEAKRNISLPGFSATADAAIGAWQLLPHLELGYDIQTRPLDIVPFTALDWPFVWQSSYTEQNAAPFNASQPSKNSSLVRSETGVKLCERWEQDWGAFLLKEKLSYVYEKPFGSGNLAFSFAGLPSDFTVLAIDQPLNFGAIGLDFLFLIGKEPFMSIDLDYEGEFSADYWFNEWILTIGQKF